MKYKNYGDNNKKYSKGTDLELLNVEDSVSARSINRPIINLYENQEETYKLLNTLLKTIYGNAGGGINNCKAIIPDVYEEFAPDGFLINSFYNTGKYFLRIPTGAAILSKNKLKDESDIYAYNEKGYKDTNIESNYSKDKWKSFTYINRPNINLLERQLASFMDLDLNNSYNDIKIETEELPVAYLIYEIDQVTNLPVLLSNGNINHLKDKSGRTLYICNEKEKADYYIEAGKIYFEERDIKYDGDLKSDNVKFKKYYYFQNQINKETDLKEIAEETNIPQDAVLLTYRLENAEYSIDFNGNPRKCIGYSLKIDETTATYKNTTFLPNKKEEAYISLMFNDLGTLSTESLQITFFNKEESVGSIPFIAKSNMSSKEVSENLISAINNDNYVSDKLKIYAKLIKAENESKYGVKIIFTDSFENNYDNYSASTTLDAENKTKINKAVRQEHYRNIFELTNDFLGKFKSDIVSTSLVQDFLTGETILPIEPPTKKSISTVDYYIYYNLTNKKEGQDTLDNSCKLVISNTELKNENYMSLFKVSVKWDSDVNNKSPKVSKVEYLLKRLDKRLIKTKRAELQTLSSTLRTNLKGDFTADADNKYIKLLKDKNDNQIRIKSPVLRFSTGDGVSEHETNNIGTDFSSKPFNEKDYSTGIDKTFYNNNKDIGLAISSEKGAQIYDGTSSADHVVELLSENGNINLITNGINSKVTLKNNKDGADNSIDLIGLTKISSKNDNQLTVESTNELLKSSAIQFKGKESGKDLNLGKIQFVKESDGVHNKIFVNKKNIIDSTDKKIEVKEDFSVSGTTNYIGDFSITSNQTKLEVKAEGVKLYTEKNYIESRVGDNNYSKISNGTIENNSTTSITNTVTAGSITNTANTSITNTANTSITNTVGNNIIEIDGSKNKIVTSSTNTTIDNNALEANINIGNNPEGKKTINIGNNVNDSNVSINAGDGSKGTIDLNGTTNINTTGTKDTSIGNNIGEENASSVTIKAGSGGVNVTGDTSIAGTLTSSDKLTVENNGASITGDTSIAGTLTSSKKLTVESNGASITGDTSIEGTANINTTGTANTSIGNSTGTTTIFGKTSVPADPVDDNSITNKKYVDDNLNTHISKGASNNESVHGSTPGTSKEDNGKNKIVQRDSNGDFYAGTITAELSGNATTASSWQNSRTFNISDGTNNGATSSVNGEENITLKLPSKIIADLTGTADKVAHSLTIQTNGTSQGTFDGSVENKTINITAANVGALGSGETAVSAERLNIIQTGGSSKPVYFTSGGVPEEITSLSLNSSISGTSITSTGGTLTLGLAKITADSAGNIKFSW